MAAEERLRLERLDGIGKEQDVLISIGIGGSYLGNQAIFDIFMVRTGICVPAEKETGTRRYSLRDRMPTRQRLWISFASFGGNGTAAAVIESAAPNNFQVGDNCGTDGGFPCIETGIIRIFASFLLLQSLTEIPVSSMNWPNGKDGNSLPCLKVSAAVSASFPKSVWSGGSWSVWI